MAVVRLDDRAADGQTHAEPVGLGAEERREHVRGGSREADSVVADRDLDGVVPRCGGADSDTPDAVGVRLHRFESVAKQVEDDLLDLHAVADDRRDVGREVEPQLDAELTGLTLDDLHGVTHQHTQDNVRSGSKGLMRSGIT